MGIEEYDLSGDNIKRHLRKQDEQQMLGQVSEEYLNDCCEKASRSILSEKGRGR